MLGPVAVWDDPEHIPIGSGRQRFVLATLLLNAGRLTSTDRLVDALWDDPPTTARPQLHNLISNVRRRLRAAGDGLIVTRPTGYELHLGEHGLDLVRFRELVVQGRNAGSGGDHERAAGLFADALALWRGPALADVADELAATTRALLGEERVSAAEARLEAQVALGRYDDVLRELEPVLTDHPYRERLHEIRMAALAASGRRADALAAYRALYRLFSDDLGVEPGPALRDLEQRILRGEAPAPVAQPAPVTVPRQLPASSPLLTGRDDLIDEIAADLARTDQAGQVRVLVGPGGVGKTSLALAAARRADHAFPDGQLFADLRGGHHAPADPHAVVGRFLRTLGVGGAEVPDDRDERVALYRSHLAGRHVLIVLDDAAGEEQVRPLLPGTPGCQVLVTSRRRLGALLGATRWSVPVLSPDDAVALLAAVIGEQRVGGAPEAAEAVVELCGRLPLAVCVAAARLAVHPEWTLEEFRSRLADQVGRLDELSVGDLDVRASIELSYQALDEPLRVLLRRLGLLLTPDWPTWVAQELTGEPSTARVERMLDRLVEMHLLEPLGRDAVGQSRYQLHDLIRAFAAERAEDEDPEDERAEAVSKVLSSWLALATEADQRADHHTIYASGLEAVAAPQVAVRATRDQPRAWLEVERTSLTSALEQASAQGHAELAGLFALRMSGFLALRAYDDEREHALEVAASALRTTGPDDLLLKILQALFAVYAQRARCGEMPALAAEALALATKLGDHNRTMRALLHAGLAARRLGRLREAAEMLDEAIRECDPDVPGSALPSLLINRAEVHRDLGEPARALPLVEDALAIRRAQGNHRLQAMNLIIYAYTLIDVHRLDDAEQALTEAGQLTEEIDDELHAAYVEQTLADVDVRLGRFAAARKRLDRALPVFTTLGNADGTAEAYRTLGELAMASGDPEAAVEPLRAALRTWRQLRAPLEAARLLARLARAHEAAGDPEAARTARAECDGILADLGLPVDCLRLPRG
ncbi:AfsR/SARP family transcriptional regulator [Actinophytocola algeriensis]|uniref:DNA-binding SARP family transcriptional activator n=1 Tax=Actinophytocola algeriensis TaxID=1768010 RepID=A0A7W7QF51_9PSEU|nr:BTAD domain-containing putative transcriptional regulator [Actinophytocola algeriensis]MBB4912184.1 DNA-binding SARP family transcriptional activator [Actinophytocola algeriensis]MBE1474300.1 DNA-binding SARP family transcriptional activator [Actinophytocola algeriensis]